MAYINLEEAEEEALRAGHALTPSPQKNSEIEIERTYLVTNPGFIRSFGKYKHGTINYIYKSKNGYLRITDKYIHPDDPIHTYKLTDKRTISGSKRIENVRVMSEGEVETWMKDHEKDLIGKAVNEIYGMPDGSVVLIRKFPNGRTIITGEHEFETEAEAKRYKLPSWATKEVTDDPKYRGNQMAIDNFK